MSTFLISIIFLCFAFLGIQASIFGAIWPIMHLNLNLNISTAGVITFFLTLSVVIFGFLSEKLNHKIGFGKSNLLGVVLLTIGTIGLAFSKNLPMLAVFSFVTGAGTGIAEITLNNYVAFYFPPRHMSWLHGAWGVGALIGPLIASYAINRQNWTYAYLIPSILQIIYVLVLFLTLSFWDEHAKKEKEHIKINPEKTPSDNRLSVSLLYVLPSILAFFFYKAAQSTTNYWGSSYLVAQKNISPSTAAKWVSLFFTGVTVCRLLSGFLTFNFNYRQITVATQIINIVGIVLLILPLGNISLMLSFFLMGIGLGAFFPAMIHDNAYFYGRENAQRINNMQIVSANIASVFLPPLLGWLSNFLSMSIFPILIAVYGVATIALYLFIVFQAKKRRAR